MFTNNLGLDKLIFDPISSNLIQVTSLVEKVVVDEGTDFGPGTWMFVVMAVLFILVLRFGRKKTPIYETEGSELKNANKDTDSGNDEDKR